MKLISNQIISGDLKIRDALMRLNEIPDTLTLFIVNEGDELIGTLTDGDIRRHLLQGKSIDDGITDFMFKDFRYLTEGDYTLDQISDFKKKNLRQIPLVDKDRRLIKIVDLKKFKTLLPIDVVIMAGGRGERLKPLTDLTPKPLLPIGNKSIIECNLDRLTKYGINHVFISVKYLADKIEEALGDGSDRGINIHYIRETEPMGTIGSVGLVNEFYHENVLIMNSDLLTNIDFEDFFRNFMEEDADMTVAAVPYHVVVPYAVLEKEDNNIISFKEKPTYTYYSNAGMYLIKRSILEHIPKDKFFNATDLMELLINQGKKVKQYPILGYWLDIGKHEDYEKAQEDIKHITL